MLLEPPRSHRRTQRRCFVSPHVVRGAPSEAVCSKASMMILESSRSQITSNQARVPRRIRESWFRSEVVVGFGIWSDRFRPSSRAEAGARDTGSLGTSLGSRVWLDRLQSSSRAKVGVRDGGFAGNISGSWVMAGSAPAQLALSVSPGGREIHGTRRAALLRAIDANRPGRRVNSVRVPTQHARARMAVFWIHVWQRGCVAVGQAPPYVRSSQHHALVL